MRPSEQMHFIYIYFLCWVFTAVCRLPLVPTSGGYTCCGVRALKMGLSGRGTHTCGWDLPGPRWNPCPLNIQLDS